MNTYPFVWFQRTAENRLLIENVFGWRKITFALSQGRKVLGIGSQITKTETLCFMLMTLTGKEYSQFEIITAPLLTKLKLLCFIQSPWENNIYYLILQVSSFLL